MTKAMTALLRGVRAEDTHPGSPYVSLYLARGQYEALLKLLEREAAK